ncbi:hypothetical protein BX666DRAFT_1935015 [Dichotomocladium elegans]|nr:hypothetical protein BX666DRAFT_1935015 [Dichotomocladium elegans]
MFKSRKTTVTAKTTTEPKRRFGLMSKSVTSFIKSIKLADSPRRATATHSFLPGLPHFSKGADDSSITDSSQSIPASPLSAHTAATLTSSIITSAVAATSTSGSGSGSGAEATSARPLPPIRPRRQSTTKSSSSYHSAATDNTAIDPYLQLGMQCHEKGELEKATHYWRLSAENDSPLGLFFYGIALRHGWGCKKSPAIAVRYLQKAAECAVYDLQKGIAKSTTIAKSELILAIYELGVCFRHGWGVPKNLTTASYYFEIAANLGDPDAQNDLAFCYAHGHGVKKDSFKAAMYYRKAARQGQGIVGNSWIWKDKYSIVDDDDWDGSHL